MKPKFLAYPYIVWMVLFIIIPLALILYYTFTAETVDGIVFTFDNLLKLSNTTYIRVIVKSFAVAFICSIVCFMLAYPLSYFLAEREGGNAGFLVFLYIIPMWMNALIRTYSWLPIIENNGILNTVLSYFGLPSVNILYTDAAVMIGMVYNFLPFMILPIYTVLKNMDKHLIEAAQDLGANNRKVFVKIVFPLSLPGVFSGFTMVFMPAVTTFLISNLLGGGQYILIGNLIERQFLNFGDWHFGSAISMILMVIILITMAVFSFLERRRFGGGVAE